MKENIIKDYYEPRYISQTNNSFANSWFNESKENNILKKVIFDKDKIVLLGNPGLGKSTELEMLFSDLWEEKDENGLIPFLINLKNFRKTNRFDDLIPYLEWKSLSSVIFILDGLDEIADIQDFISALEVFISQNKLLNIRYVLSCRTNIYQKYLVNISNFSTFFLDDLNREQSRNLLIKKYDIEIDKFNLLEIHQNYLKTPFFLDLFASYILVNKTLPQTDSEMWELFIKKTLDIYTKKQVKKKIVDRVKLINDLKKVSFVNELMQKNYSSNEELHLILNGNHLDFIENPFFVELDNDSSNWNFVHRQIQEYFVAKILSGKSVEEILSIIKIPNIDIEVIHPSLFNSMTFLINLLDRDSTTFIDLISWIQTNQIELLFKADSDRTSSFKVQVFQNYFSTQCVEKTFWIGNNSTFSAKEIADFGDCDDNFNFLLNFIKDHDAHFRVRISALELLSFFEVAINRKSEIKDFYMRLLFDVDETYSIKSKVIKCITTQNLCYNNDEYLDSILEIFREDTNKEINRALLSLIRDYVNGDRLFWYIKLEFLRENKIIKRKEIDKVHRGNNWVLQEFLLKVENSDYFIELMAYYFIRGHNLDLGNELAEKILKRCLFFSVKEDDFTIRFLAAINGKTEYYRHERLLKEIVLQSNSQSKATKYLLENNAFDTIRSFLSGFINSESLVFVKNHFLEGKVTAQEIEYFRNSIGNSNDKLLGEEFNIIMLGCGINFVEAYFTKDNFDEYQVENNLKHQHNFDILFEKDKLLDEIKIVFQENMLVINESEIRKIESDWYEKNGYSSNTIDTSLEILNTLVYHYNKNLTFQEVQFLLENDFIRFDKIKSLIKGNVNSNVRFVVSDVQKADIIGWCIKASSEINFNEIIKLYDNDSFNYGLDYEKLKTILSFLDEYEFELPKEFLLNSLEYFDTDRFNENDDVCDKLFTRIDDVKIFNERIVYNILNKKMFSFVTDRHVSYALEHKLEDTFSFIRNYFKGKSPSYNLDSKLEKYIELTQDFGLLKECCEDVNNHICWSACDILMKLNKKERDFCKEKAIEYLELKVEEDKKHFLSQALGILFELNCREVLNYVLKSPEQDLLSWVNESKFSNYSIIEDYNILEKLFYMIYNKDVDEIKSSSYISFFNRYVFNLSKASDESYSKIQQIFLGIKSKLTSEISDNQLFYVNHLIENSTKSYINSKSKPMKFDEALRKVEEIIN